MRSRKEQEALTREEKVVRSQQRRKKKRPLKQSLTLRLDAIDDRMVFKDHDAFNNQLGHLHRLLNYAANIVRDNGVLEQTAEQTAELKQIVEQISLSILGKE
jgi:hypothetical protein